jgi:signal transduction histidine kinase
MRWSEAEILGRSADEIFTPEDRDRAQPEEEMRQALTHGRGEDKRWYMRRDGSRFWGDGVMCLLKDEAGTTRGFAKILRNRTADLRAEEARREADRRKDEFLAMLAHELRNPLSAIGHASQLLLRPDASAETIAWSHEVIARQVQNLSRMIKKLKLSI